MPPSEKIRVAFLGRRILGYRCLELLEQYKDSFDVRFVVVPPHDGEDNSDWNPKIPPLAKKMGIEVLEPENLKGDDILQKFKDEKIDLILNPFYSHIVPKAILDIPKYGTINFHYGKLPEYKGRFVVSHMILNGETQTVATAHYMSEKLDEGDIIFEEPVEIKSDDTAKTLYMRCVDAGVVAFEKVLDYIKEGKELPRTPQEGAGNYFPFEEPNGCEVDLSWDREKQERFIRALTFPPISRPWMQINGQKFEIIPKDEQ